MVDTHVALCHIDAQGRIGSATPATASHCTAMVYLLYAGVAVWRPARLTYLITGYNPVVSPLTRHFSAATPFVLW